MSRWIIFSKNGNATTLRLQGQWEGPYLEQVQAELRILPDLPSKVSLVADELGRLDTAAAWILVRWLRMKQAAGTAFEISGFSEDQAKVLAMVEKLLCPVAETCPAAAQGWRQIFVVLGQGFTAWLRDMHDLLAFFGQLALVSARLFRRPGRLRIRSTVYHLFHIGLLAVPIISLLAFLISLVLGYQGVAQLSKFNAQTFTLDAVAISMLREMGVLLTSIMVAGRSGSAFTAQIGVMKLNQEVDAMRTLGLDPFEILVVPRVIAIVIALPVLTFIADMVGLFGAITVGVTMLDMSLAQCLYRIEATIKLNTFLVGMVKAPVFALLIGLVGCLRGLQVKNAADEVGKQTTIAVVQAIFLIIMADALFSILFTLLKV
jgi:phospholipid/cholesterol/gamma-HCH transport system permease protein